MTTRPGRVPPRLPRTVRIRYLRPPARWTTYTQTLVHDDGRVKVTVAEGLELDAPLVFEGTTALEPGADAVWFTFPGAWHDIGRFHSADGMLSGLYANVITPCLFRAGGEWTTTDLFLDVWIPAAEGRVHRSAPLLLDQEELAEAEAAGHVTPELARRAWAEGNRLLRAARSGNWPPPVVHEWTLERARAFASGGR